MVWFLNGLLFLIGPLAVIGITITPSIEHDIKHENQLISTNITASERNRRLIPYMSYYVPQNSYPISQHYLIEQQNAPSLSSESSQATIANNKPSVIHLPIAYIQMKVPHSYESNVQSTNLPYTEQHHQQHLQQYEIQMPSYKFGKKKVTPFSPSNIVPGSFVPIVYADNDPHDNRISNSGKPTNPNIETTYIGNTGQIQHSTNVNANNVVTVSTTESPRPYYSNNGQQFVYVTSHQNEERAVPTTTTTTKNKITSQEKYVLYLREQLRHKQYEQLKDHEQKQQQMQNQIFYTTPTYQTSTQPTLHFHSPAPSKEYLKTSQPIILQNIQEKPQNHYYHEQRQPQSQHLNGQQLREKEEQRHYEEDRGKQQQQFYYHQHQSHDEIYQKQNTSPPQVHNNQHHPHQQQQQQHQQHHHHYQQQHYQQQQNPQQQDDDHHDYRNQPLQHHHFYHQSPNKENTPQLKQENSIETQSQKPPIQIIIAEVKPTIPSKHQQSYESYLLIPSPAPPIENEATPSTELTPVYRKPLVLQQLAPIQRPHRPKAKPFRFNKHGSPISNRLNPSLQSPITNYYQTIPYKSPPVRPKNNKVIKLRPVPNFEYNSVQQEQEIVQQPTVPTIQSIRYKEEEPIAHPPIDQKTESLKEILKKLQDSNHLPKTFTADNIDNSIKTLIKILNNLKESQTIIEYPSQHHEEDYDYQAHQHSHNHNNQEQNQQSENSNKNNGGENIVYKDVDETDLNDSDPTPNNGRPGVDYPILAEIPKTKFDCKEQRYKGFFGDTETNCQVWHYCDLNGGQASFLCPNGTIFSQVALTCDWWFNVKCANTPQQYVLNERLYKYILPFTPKFPEDYNGPLVDKYLALKFKEMEEKMQKEKQKGRPTTDEEKINDVDTFNDEDIGENHGTIDTYYNNEIEKIPATTDVDGGITKPTTFRNGPIVVPATETTASATTTDRNKSLEAEEVSDGDGDEIMKKKTVTEISVEKVNVIEIRPDGSTGHIIPSMIYQASQT